MKTTTLPADSKEAIREASQWLQKGQAVAFPTDTVYGLGAALTAPAIDRLFQIKGRDSSKAIAVLVGDAGALTQVAASPGAPALRLAERFWPGPLTLVVTRHSSLPGNLSPLPTVGVRMPDHPAALELLNLAGPLAVTSANRSGGPNAATAGEVREQLQGLIPLILDGGQTPGGLPSTVVDCTGAQLKILRQGPITLVQILEAAG